MEELADYFDYWDFSYEHDNDSYFTSLISQIYNLCLEPTLSEILPHIGKLLFFCLIFRLFTQIKFMPVSIGHLVSAVCGMLVLYNITSASYVLLMYIVGLYIVMNITIFLSKSDWPYLTALVCSIVLILNEFVFPIPELWNETRGQHMIATMKGISIAFDMRKGIIRTYPTFLEYVGYLLCPCNCLFGPWISFNTYKAIFSVQSPLFEFKWVKNTVITTLKSIMFLTMSNCWSYYLIPTSWSWLGAYQEAFSFRTSHYFISFLSEAAMLVGGFGYVGNEKKKEEAAWPFEVTRPTYIEFPRSSVNVVVVWNMPMHMWLKNYVFLECKPAGSFFALIMTYAISSLLHGFNLKIAAVLLSLGFHTYIEYKLRRKLCTIFNACIGANRCTNCQHLYKSNVYVVLTNIMFGFITMFHLTYLGCLLENSAGSYGTYKEGEVFDKWKNLNYASHWFLFFEYYVYKVI